MSCIFSMQDILTWTELDLHLLVACFLRVRFPIVVALNKADTAEATEHIAKVQVWPLAAGGLGWQWGDPTRKVAWPDLGFCEKKTIAAYNQQNRMDYIWTCVFWDPSLLSCFAVGSVSCSPSTRQLLKIRWPFRRAVNYGFCSSSGKASGIAVRKGGPRKKTHGKHKSLIEGCGLAKSMKVWVQVLIGCMKVASQHFHLQNTW